MNPMSEKPRIIVKAKNIQLVLDQCLQEKTEFTVIPRNASNDEWEIELNIKSISKAIEWGMFIKANRLDFSTNELFKTVETTPVPKVKPKEKTRKVTTGISKSDNDNIDSDDQIKKNEQPSLLSFE